MFSFVSRSKGLIKSDIDLDGKRERVSCNEVAFLNLNLER